MPQPSARNHRNNPYFFDEMLVRGKRTAAGRLPLVLRIHPTKVGERALIWCRAGICAADFEAHTPEIAAACYARQARVEGNKRWAQLLYLDIVRRDTLGAHHVIPSGLADTSPRWRKAS